MDEQAKREPELTPAVLHGVATQPHPTTHALPGDVPTGGAGVLQDVLPEITEVARKVGGFKRLAEIAAQLDRAGIGQ